MNVVCINIQLACVLSSAALIMALQSLDNVVSGSRELTIVRQHDLAVVRNVRVRTRTRKRTRDYASQRAMQLPT